MYPFSTTVCSRAFKGSTSKAASAIKAAIEAGELERWNSYISLKSEAKYSDDKVSYLRQKQQWGKEIAKWSKQKMKERW